MIFRRLFIVVFAMIHLTCFVKGEDRATQIQQEMVRIRRSTDWSNPQAAKDANEKILKLGKELMQIRNSKAKGTVAQPPDADDKGFAGSQLDIFDQAAKSAAKGKDAPILLGETIGKEIERDLEEERDQTIKNPRFFEELTVLTIDFSMPTANFLVSNLDKFKTVKTLVLTATRPGGASIALSDVLKKGAGLPLEELWIFNFRTFVTAIPDSVGTFKNLKKLGLFNNNIRSLPPSIANLERLTTLLVDVNPISTLSPMVTKLYNLEELGVARTSITAAEIAVIQNELPQCRILNK